MTIGTHMTEDVMTRRAGGKLSRSQRAMKAARAWAAQPELKAPEIGACFDVSGSSVERARRVLKYCKPDVIADIESGKVTVAHAVWNLQGRPNTTRRGVMRQELLNRAYRKAVIETEACCVSMLMMVQIPEDMSREELKFALAALERARVHLTRTITNLKSGKESK